jgi:hypothetical protein
MNIQTVSNQRWNFSTEGRGNGDRSDPWENLPAFDGAHWCPSEEAYPALASIRREMCDTEQAV